MFQYSDPVKKSVLQDKGALGIYREILEDMYDFANTNDNAFESLERLPTDSPTEFIEWAAFPVTANTDDESIDNERFKFQDEYVEWRVEKSADGKVTQVTFTTEFPEYYQALAEVSEAALIAGIQDAIPGATPTTEELFGPGFDPNNANPFERSQAFRSRHVVGFSSSSQTVPSPWNNNSKGILCLGQRFNTMGALFNLARACSVPSPGNAASSQCSLVGGACGPSRASDPQICERSQVVARIPRGLSLQDPVGVKILRINGAWRKGSDVFDINDPQNNDIWEISRNGRRATLKLTGDITVNNQPVISGSQVSKLVDVGAEVISALPGDFLSIPDSDDALEATPGGRKFEVLSRTND